MNQLSPISLRMETIDRHPGKLNISLTSSIGASDGISRSIIVLRPADLILALILLSTTITVGLFSNDNLMRFSS